MLEIKNIKKSYTTGEFTQHALKDVSLDFRKNEFVAILGPSGSGKTTLLNIIGGLDRYDEGDLIINNKSTKKFKDTEWDAYRNNCIGFIFQSYNLINHISVLDNVEMGMTLSGVSQAKRKAKALEVLKRVGLEEHTHKKPNQLSGGQMQRVAIARALANDPDIILADEPTGALDSETSVQIMNLIQEIAKDKLVIMVTHNPDLAEEYASRIIEMKDGELLSDSNPIKKEEKDKNLFQIRKTSMNFLTALKLSFNNIRTKKGRTILTSFAASIGIIGIALILSLSNGFDIQIGKFERDTLSNMPIMISEQAMKMDADTMSALHGNDNKLEEYTNKKLIYPQKPMDETATHKNVITEEYMNYIKKLDSKDVAGISYMRSTSLNMITKFGDKYKQVSLSPMEVSSIPEDLNGSIGRVITDNYDLLTGTMPSKKEELLIMLDSKNRISTKVLEALGFDSTKASIPFSDLIGKEIKIVFNDSYYKEVSSFFTINTNFEELYNSTDGVTLKITGIVRGMEDKKTLTSGSSGFLYTESLVNYVIEQNKNSKIVTSQEKADYNVLTGEKFTDDADGKTDKENMLSYLGKDGVPVVINIYPLDFAAKESILEHLDKYNEGKSETDRVMYTDLGEMISSLSSSIMDAITIVLIAFSGISLVVSSIMIGIITYISVLERTKEIGVLRALGARKKDIKRVFSAETFIIGLCSGLLGLIIARLLIFPINAIIYSLTELSNVANLNPVHALILLAISVILTMIGGYIPSRMASKKDPVDALRTE